MFHYTVVDVCQATYGPVESVALDPFASFAPKRFQEVPHAQLRSLPVVMPSQQQIRLQVERAHPLLVGRPLLRSCRARRRCPLQVWILVLQSVAMAQ